MRRVCQIEQKIPNMLHKNTLGTKYPRYHPDSCRPAGTSFCVTCRPRHTLLFSVPLSIRCFQLCGSGVKLSSLSEPRNRFQPMTVSLCRKTDASCTFHAFVYKIIAGYYITYGMSKSQEGKPDKETLLIFSSKKLLFQAICNHRAKRCKASFFIFLSIIVYQRCNICIIIP